MSENVLLKQVLDEVKDLIKSEIGGLKLEMGSLKSDMNERFDGLETDIQVLKGGQQGIRNELTDRFAETRVNFKH